MRLMSFHPLYLLCVLSIWRKTYVFFCNDFVSPSLKHKPIACLLCTFYYSFSVILTRIQNLWRTIFQLTMLIKDYLENKPVIHINPIPYVYVFSCNSPLLWYYFKYLFTIKLCKCKDCISFMLSNASAGGQWMDKGSDSIYRICAMSHLLEKLWSWEMIQNLCYPTCKKCLFI